MMTPDELISYMEQVSDQLPEESLEGDVYTMVMFAIELGKLAEFEIIAKELQMLNSHLNDINMLIRSVERRGGFKR